jgi:hypothetical protein
VSAVPSGENDRIQTGMARPVQEPGDHGGLAGTPPGDVAHGDAGYLWSPCREKSMFKRPGTKAHETRIGMARRYEQGG